MGDGILRAEPPLPAHLGERQVTVVTECHARHRQRRELSELTAPLQCGKRRADPLPGVRVHDVPQVPRGDEQVFVAVEIHVEELGAPGPVGSLDPGVARELREGAVAAVPEKRVALPLGSVIDLPDQLGQGRVRRDLGLAARAAAQHIRDEDVHVPVPVDVGEIHCHRGVAGVTERKPRRGAKRPPAVVQP